MSIRNENREFPEERLNADATIGVPRATNFDTARVRIIRHDPSVRESEEALQEFGNSNRRHVDTVLRNRLKRCVRRCLEVPIKLSVDSAWPLNDHVATNWIRKRVNEDVRSRCLRC